MQIPRPCLCGIDADVGWARGVDTSTLAHYATIQIQYLRKIDIYLNASYKLIMHDA